MIAISAAEEWPPPAGRAQMGVSSWILAGGGHAPAHADFSALKVAACRRAGRDGGSLPALDAQHPQRSVCGWSGATFYEFQF